MKPGHGGGIHGGHGKLPWQCQHEWAIAVVQAYASELRQCARAWRGFGQKELGGGEVAIANFVGQTRATRRWRKVEEGEEGDSAGGFALRRRGRGRSGR